MKLGHKLGPLPLWGWGAVAVIGIVLVRGYLSASTDAEVSTDGEPPVIGARFATRRPSNLPVPPPAAGRSEDLGAAGSSEDLGTSSGASSGLLTAARGPGGLTSTEGTPDGAGGVSAPAMAAQGSGPTGGAEQLPSPTSPAKIPPPKPPPRGR